MSATKAREREEKKKNKKQSAESLGLCVRSAFISAVSRLRGIQYDTLGGEGASKLKVKRITQKEAGWEANTRSHRY